MHMRVAKFIPALALFLMLGASAAHAQTGTTATGSTTTYPSGTTAGAGTGTTPGTPNTGAGGNAEQNALILTTTGAVALLGGLYLLRARAR